MGALYVYEPAGGPKEHHVGERCRPTRVRIDKDVSTTAAAFGHPRVVANPTSSLANTLYEKFQFFSLAASPLSPENYRHHLSLQFPLTGIGIICREMARRFLTDPFSRFRYLVGWIVPRDLRRNKGNFSRGKRADFLTKY